MGKCNIAGFRYRHKNIPPQNNYFYIYTTACHIVEKENLTSIALPRLATGVGGLEWSEVKPLIEQRLGGLQIPVIVYSEFHPGVAAQEGLEVAKA